MLDENNKLVEDGNVGEICVRGTSLTLGYYNNFEKTSEVFVQNPLNSRYPELIYKTGDLGKRNERGELIFVSRKDYQIKHMGHRIELGEIEVNVNMIEEISTSCAVYDKEKGKIVLYYIGELEPDKLVRLLKDKLPRDMIPNKTEKLEQMPLTANGKIDRVFLMKKAQETRLGYNGYKTSFKSVAMLGSNIFLRSMDKAESLQHSLDSRGYDGEIPMYKPQNRSDD